MKSKSNLLIAMGAVLGLFVAAPAWAQSYRIGSISRVTESGATTLSEPLTAGSILYFDVTLTDSTQGSGRWTFSGNAAVSGIGTNRPYLQLDMPLRGQSVKQSTESDTEAATVETNTAVAYYVGQAPGGTATSNQTVMRFAYTVRPGDLAANLKWAENGSGNPIFGGDLTKIQLTYMAGDGVTQNVGLDSSCLLWASDPGDPSEAFPVNGYTLTVGDDGDFNSGFLYQGLVPMTVSAPEGSVSAFTSTSNANNCYLWLEVQDDDGTWKQVPAGVVQLSSDRVTVSAGDASAGLLDAFTLANAGRFIGRTSSTSAFTSQRFFVNLPKNDAYGPGTAVRICYGVNPDSVEGLYGYWEFPVTEAPFITAGNQGTTYEVTNPNLAGAAQDPFFIGGTSVTNGGTVTAGAGETVTVSIRKQNIDLYQTSGTLYAIVERLTVKSDENKDNADVALASSVTPSRTYVPLDPLGLADGTVSFTLPGTIGTGEVIYRIRVPELEHMASTEGPAGTIDCPYYLRIQTTSRREDITIQAGEAGYTGQEYYSPLPTAEGSLPSFLEYTLSVASSSDNARTFLVYPVAADGTTQITEDYYYTDTPPTVENGVLTGGRKVQDNIARYAVLQRNSGSITSSAGPEYTVSIPRGQTSATFYVALVNDFPQNYLAGSAARYEVQGGAAQQVGAAIQVPDLPIFRAATCNASGVVTGLSDTSDTVEVVISNRAPTLQSYNAPTSAAAGSGMRFSFQVNDTVGDYLFAEFSSGSGETIYRLYVDEEEMIALMGEAAWEQYLKTEFLDPYGITDRDSFIQTRAAHGAQTITFTNVVAGTGSEQTWTFTVRDSSGEQATQTGTITLSTAQRFTVYTNLDTLNSNGAGRVQFADELAGTSWLWGNEWTYTSLSRGASGSTVTLTATPFLAGETYTGGNFANYMPGIPPTKDSFFYAWQPYEANMGATWLESPVYGSSVTLNRQGVGQDDQAWVDVVLRAVFVTEYLPGDAWTNFTRTDGPSPYNDQHVYNYANAFRLGDYNQDGVPDGYLLATQGDTEETRALIEGGSVATVAPEGDTLPALGWQDGVYRFGSSAGKVASGSFAATGTPFGYKLRVRGRDEALNAAHSYIDEDGDRQGRWLSNPKWQVVVLGEASTGNDQTDPMGLLAGTHDFTTGNTAGTFTLNTRVITLAVDKQGRDDILWTGTNRIPYMDAPIEDVDPLYERLCPGDQDQGWRYVIDSDGQTVQAANETDKEVTSLPYRFTNVLVNIDPNSDDYEQIRVEYTAPWGWITRAFVYATRQATGPDGEPLVDGEGNPVMERIPETDANGYPLYDANGNPVYQIAKDASGANRTEWKYRYYLGDQTLENPTYAGDVGTHAVPFPFTEWGGADNFTGYYAATHERTPAAGAGTPPTDEQLPVNEYRGGVSPIDSQYYFAATRAPAGMLLDEPFFEGRRQAVTNYIRADYTDWLERFPSNSADVDNDGVPNGVEYWLWYYASRIAMGSYFSCQEPQFDENGQPVRDAQGNQLFVARAQLNPALWPAIDLNQRTALNTGAQFAMGRRYNNGYRGNGQFWTATQAADVLSAFHPLQDTFGGDYAGDFDNDGLGDAEEIALGTNPIDCDTDGDGIPDGWENAFELNPSSANDGGANPDGDYYAVATLYLHPTYNHLFRVDAFKAASVAAKPSLDLPNVDAGDDLTRVAFYDYEAGLFRTVDENYLAGTDTVAQAHFSLLPAATLEDVEAWSAEPACYMEIRQQVTLKDFDVYQALGFDPRTGWYGALPSSVVNLPKFQGLAAVNTAAYTNVEEFNSSVRRAYRDPPRDGVTMNYVIGHSDNPQSADTNNNGIPDGWENYVGFVADGDYAGADQDGDGLSAAQEFHCRVANLLVEDPDKAAGTWPTSLADAMHDVGGATWANKLLPTDPWDPDTDGDGILDAQEGSLFVYGTTADSYTNGGGCDPNKFDTDGDSIADGWEFRFGEAAVRVIQDLAAENDAGETEIGVGTDETVKLAIDWERFRDLGPDPTCGIDATRDPDRDGLPNIQEYLTGLMRHWRYDLGPKAARLYADDLGLDGDGRSVRTPDVYNALEDLAYELSVVSPIYGSYDADGAEPVRIDPIKQAQAARVEVDAETCSRTAIKPVLTRLNAGIANAVSRRFGATVVYPTRRQIVDLALPFSTALADKIALLDAMVYFMPQGLDAHGMGSDGQILYLIRQIEQGLEAIDVDLNDGRYATFKAEALELWAIRKQQILDYLFGIAYTPANGEYDPAYAGMARLTTDGDAAAGDDGTPAVNPIADYTPPAEPVVGAGTAGGATAYEERLCLATTPFLQTQYRAGLRGLNGGVLILKSKDQQLAATTNGGIYVAPVGYHLPLFEDGRPGKPFGSNPVGADNAILALGEIGVRYPIVNRNTDGTVESLWDPFVTTNPLVADSDADGMDDYWEIFHGLNPILGDYSNLAYGNGSIGHENYAVDKIHAVYAGKPDGLFEDGEDAGGGRFATDIVWFADTLAPAGKGANAFGNPALEEAAVTGYDYYSYPWVAGAPFADPDGDGLLNAEEAVNPNGDAARYGTDPSPLWMTDPANPNSLVTRFYGRVNANLAAAGVVPALVFPYPKGSIYNSRGVVVGQSETPAATASVFPYEINEGFDTDGDGTPDMVELTSDTVNRGDPQTLRSPSRQQAAYFGGQGAMQSMAETHFGPYALQTFTLECWVKPDTEGQAENEVILIDRPWRFYTGVEPDLGRPLGALRHNFRLGLRKGADGLTAFAYYTSAGTTAQGGAATPQKSSEATANTVIEAGKWTHLAVTYDGSALRLYINGQASGSASTGLTPANGLISVANSDPNDVQRYTYRAAPILIGAGPGEAWTAELDADGILLDTAFANRYKGFIDEVRIWNGARTAAEIANNRTATFSQADLLNQRYAVFAARYSGDGVYQTGVPAALVAQYTFDDLLAGARKTPVKNEGADKDEFPYLDENGNPVASEDEAAREADDKPWEAYPGQHTIGDASVSGSLLFRRRNLEANTGVIVGGNDVYVRRPENAAAVYTTYYRERVPETLQTTLYDVANADFVPMAHNTIDHLPLADVERATANLLYSAPMKNGTPDLLFPSGTPLNVKPADSVYWTPYGAGVVTNASSTAVYSVKTQGNPYAYLYRATVFFDVPTHRALPAYSTQVPADLLLFGDVFAKYDPETWADGSPTTDPSGGNGSGSDVQPGTPSWFEHDDSTSADDLTDSESSKGGSWLEDNVGLGQTTDTDGDLMPNWWENHYGLDPEDATGDNGPHGDPDGDFLTNYAEWLAKSAPNNPSTAGNGITDFNIPIWMRRGRPTFGLLYTDNDFMEDHWEAENRSEALNVDMNDTWRDADNDGWSNWAEARANFRTGRHSTDPQVEDSATATGGVRREYPTPALRLTVDYFGDQNVYTNATESARIVVHSYTAVGNNSQPDAQFYLPMSTLSGGEGSTAGTTVTAELGNWVSGTVSGFVHMGNVRPGSFDLTYAYVWPIPGSVENNLPQVTFHIADNQKGELYLQAATATNVEETAFHREDFNTTIPVGKIDYATGEYSIDFSATSQAGAESWADGLFEIYNPITTTSADGTPLIPVGAELVYINGVPYAYYAMPYTNFTGTLTSAYVLNAGSTNTFTLVTPDSGHLKEGTNNFFVFADFDGNGNWNTGEPAGVPDQHDVEIGFDRVSTTLHVTLTESAPPGGLRFDVATVLAQLKEDLATGTTDDGGEMTSSVINGAYPESAEVYLNPKDFESIIGDNSTGGGHLYVALAETTGVGGGDASTSYPRTIFFDKEYDAKKPYLNEDEIYARYPNGIPPPESVTVTSATYLVFLVPSAQVGITADQMTDYCIGAVTNRFIALNDDLTGHLPVEEGALIGGSNRRNSELTFAWTSNVQVPNFDLKIVKTSEADGTACGKTVFNSTIRGVSAYAEDDESGQYRYRYTLPRGIGELNSSLDTLFGNGYYHYTLKLNAYTGSDKTLEGDFAIAMRDSSDASLRETEGAEQSTAFNAQDSYFVRAKIRYTGVLKESADFNKGLLVVEAHRSASFNGDPAAANSDILIYDDEDEAARKLNRTIRMSKSETYTITVGDQEGQRQTQDAFYATCFDVELRGLSTDEPVYLKAYFDLNRNGRHDRWEPWGYAMQGQSAASGFYFDPQPLTPARTGDAVNAEFYIQDVDTDNDKLADSYEWLNNGFPAGSFNDWCGALTGTSANQDGQAIWCIGSDGKLAFTAYGAQLYGLSITGVDPATGAVTVDGMPDDLQVFRDFAAILGEDTALAILADMEAKGYTHFAIQINGLNFDPSGTVSFDWDVVGVKVEEGQDSSIVHSEAITAAFRSASNKARFAVYGKKSLGDEQWELLSAAKVSETITAGQSAAVQLDSKDYLFFKVRLTSENPEQTITD